MGLRHLVVVDGELSAVGIITRADMNEHTLHHYWEEEGDLTYLPTSPYSITYHFSPEPLPLMKARGCMHLAGGERESYWQYKQITLVSLHQLTPFTAYLSSLRCFAR